MAALLWEQRIEGEVAPQPQPAAPPGDEGGDLDAFRILRIKGVVSLCDCPTDDDEAGESGEGAAAAAAAAAAPQRYIVQGVHEIFELLPLRLAAEDDSVAPEASTSTTPPAASNALVIIGQGVAAAAPRLATSLARLLSAPV